MQMGDHQMMGNQRAYVQKVMPGANGAPNAGFMQGQAVRVNGNGGPQQRVVQLAPGTRQVIQNGAGPHLVRQVQPGQQQQQFQPNYANGGTIAGRSVAAAGMPVRTVQNGQPIAGSGQQQTFYHRTTTMAQQQAGGQRGVYVTSSQMSSSQQGQVRYAQTHQQGVVMSSQYHQIHQARGIQNPQRPPPQQIRQIPQQPPARVQQQIQNPGIQNPQIPPQHLQNLAPQMNQNPQIQQQYQQQYQQGQPANLAVPLREPSPEPVPIKIEEPEEVRPIIKEEDPDDDEPIDIQIRNVVCNYTLPLHIDLRKLAMNTNNVTYEREKGVMMKQKRDPNCYIKVYSSGKVYIVGCRSEEDCKKASRSIARHVQKVMGKAHERVVIRNYRVNNVLATCRLPFGIKIEEVAEKYPSEATYEPELSVGLVWRSTAPKATLRIHTTGSITVTGASSEQDVVTVLGNIYPIVKAFKCPERAKGAAAAAVKRKRKAPTSRGPSIKREKLDNAVYGNSGVVNNKVYFSDEDEDLYDDLELDE